MSKKPVVNLITFVATILGFAGFALLYLWGGWKISLAVFMIVWAMNIEKKGKVL
jgi:hypothetical protein